MKGLLMLESLLQPAHLVILLLILIFLFGGKIFANLGKGFAAAARNFRSSLHPPDKP
jgi:Sec-independent protein translocase protein TatA